MKIFAALVKLASIVMLAAMPRCDACRNDTLPSAEVVRTFQPLTDVPCPEPGTASTFALSFMQGGNSTGGTFASFSVSGDVGTSFLAVHIVSPEVGACKVSPSMPTGNPPSSLNNELCPGDLNNPTKHCGSAVYNEGTENSKIEIVFAVHVGSNCTGTMTVEANIKDVAQADIDEGDESICVGGIRAVCEDGLISEPEVESICKFTPAGCVNRNERCQPGACKYEPENTCEAKTGDFVFCLSAAPGGNNPRTSILLLLFAVLLRQIAIS
jgi:hypothetical protein